MERWKRDSQELKEILKRRGKQFVGVQGIFIFGFLLIYGYDQWLGTRDDIYQHWLWIQMGFSFGLVASVVVRYWTNWRPKIQRAYDELDEEERKEYLEHVLVDEMEE